MIRSKLQEIALVGLALLLMASPARGERVTPREGTLVDQARVEKIIAEYLEEKGPVLPEARIRLKSLTAPPSFVLPQGELSYEVYPSHPDILGSRRFTLIFRVDGRVEKNIPVRAELEALAPVVVAAADLRRGTELAEEDLEMVEVDLVGLREPCFDAGELVGKRLKRRVRPGDPIDRGIVEFPPMVQRGEAVTITVSRGGLKLTALGEAREDGRQGESIRVRNNSSRKDILCKVLAPGLAEVEF